MNGMKFKLLAQDIEANPELVHEFEKITLDTCKVKIPAAKKPKGRNMTVKSFSTWVKEAW